MHKIPQFHSKKKSNKTLNTLPFRSFILPNDIYTPWGIMCMFLLHRRDTGQRTLLADRGIVTFQRFPRAEFIERFRGGSPFQPIQIATAPCTTARAFPSPSSSATRPPPPPTSSAAASSRPPTPHASSRLASAESPLPPTSAPFFLTFAPHLPLHPASAAGVQ